MLRAIVTDIEGTTSSLSFVKDVLFPYARKHIRSYVENRAQDSEVVQLLDDARREAGHPEWTNVQVVDQFISWIDADKKITSLKAIQGLIWEEGFQRGEYRGHIYADAAEALRRWHTEGKKLYVYSSGSVFAQKLLFSYSDFGDLSELFSGYFDTRIGMKQDTNSYQAILKNIDAKPEQVLFLSDIEAELDAAAGAGMQTRWLVRERAPVSGMRHEQVSSFAKIETFS